MDIVIKQLKKERLQKWLTLIFLMLVVFMARNYMSQILLIVIFSYISYFAIKKIRKFTKLNQVFGTLTFYIALIGVITTVFSMTAKLVYQQLQGIPDIIEQANKFIIFDNDYFTELVKSISKSSQIFTSGKYIALSGLAQLGKIGVGLEHIFIALFLSFIFNLTYQHLRDFGHNILESDYPHFFNISAEIIGKYVSILGKVVETQLIICSINTILMLIGLWIIGIPKLLLVGLVIFILGLIPVAGVLISLIPLGVFAFAVHGLIGVLSVLILVIIVHMFESYFLHPRLMAGALDLPIFVTFITLIISAKMIGTWGFIIGIPTVAFFLDFLGIKFKTRE